MRQVGRNNIILGLVIAGVGVLVSLGSYQGAKDNGGGTYFLFWGVVVYGLYRAYRGARMYFASSGSNDRYRPLKTRPVTHMARSAPEMPKATASSSPSLTEAYLPAAPTRPDLDHGVQDSYDFIIIESGSDPNGVARIIAEETGEQPQNILVLFGHLPTVVVSRVGFATAEGLRSAVAKKGAVAEIRKLN
jgi:hypothetical protein